jgi:hypothetical protein
MIKCQCTSECITKAWSEVRGFATTGPRVYVLLESEDVIFVSLEHTAVMELVVQDVGCLVEWQSYFK